MGAGVACWITAVTMLIPLAFRPSFRLASLGNRGGCSLLAPSLAPIPASRVAEPLQQLTSKVYLAQVSLWRVCQILPGPPCGGSRRSPQ